mgnify:CR=1 FL=1
MCQIVPRKALALRLEHCSVRWTVGAMWRPATCHMASILRPVCSSMMQLQHFAPCEGTCKGTTQAALRDIAPEGSKLPIALRLSQAISRQRATVWSEMAHACMWTISVRTASTIVGLRFTLSGPWTDCCSSARVLGTRYLRLVLEQAQALRCPEIPSSSCRPSPSDRCRTNQGEL